MRPSRLAADLLRTLALVALVSGCGLKGPLRLPDRAQPAAESPAPAATQPESNR